MNCFHLWHSYHQLTTPWFGKTAFSFNKLATYHMWIRQTSPFTNFDGNYPYLHFFCFFNRIWTVPGMKGKEQATFFNYVRFWLLPAYELGTKFIIHWYFPVDFVLFEVNQPKKSPRQWSLNVRRMVLVFGGIL